MKRDQFLNELRLALSGLTAEELNGVTSYYTEIIDDRMETGMTEEEAIAAMEPIDVIAKQVFADRPASKPSEQSTDREKTVTYAAGGIREVRVKAREQRIKVIQGTDENITLRYRDTLREPYHVTCQDGKLSLVREPISNFTYFLLHFGIHWDIGGIEVILPKEFAGSVDLETFNSNITASDITCWGSFHAHTSNSKIAARNMSAKKIDLKTGNSKIELVNVSAQNELMAKTSNSRITAENTVAGSQLSLITSNGHISVTNIKSPEITLRSSNSGITGSIDGKREDYAIVSGTSNAHSNLPSENTGGTKKLSVHTSNAGIQILFAG
jgi:hypothetical protein